MVKNQFFLNFAIALISGMVFALMPNFEWKEGAYFTFLIWILLNQALILNQIEKELNKKRKDKK